MNETKAETSENSLSAIRTCHSSFINVLPAAENILCVEFIARILITDLINGMNV